ncbi:hypothetical protein D3C77_603930 [compost metagenome]
MSMSRVTDLDSQEVVDYCANEACGNEIYFGQSVWKIGRDLVCSSECLLAQLKAKPVVAGKDTEKGGEGIEHNS